MSPDGGSPALAECRVRVELIAERVRGYVRARTAKRPSPPLHRTACRTCREQGHARAACPLRKLDLWTDGDRVLLARSARDAADWLRARWHPPMVRTTEGEWFLLAADADGRFTIAGVTAELRAWARANGRGMLAAGGKLLPGRKVPR